jgi:transposase InsO family protein
VRTRSRAQVSSKDAAPYPCNTLKAKHFGPKPLVYTYETIDRAPGIELLTAHKIQPSMSRSGNPYDNAACESFMRTLKSEEIYCHRWRNLEALRESVAEFLEVYYNRQRLHSALGYQTPIEFEEQTMSAKAAVASKEGQ